MNNDHLQCIKNQVLAWIRFHMVTANLNLSIKFEDIQPKAKAFSIFCSELLYINCHGWPWILTLWPQNEYPSFTCHSKATYLVERYYAQAFTCYNVWLRQGIFKSKVTVTFTSIMPAIIYLSWPMCLPNLSTQGKKRILYNLLVMINISLKALGVSALY